MERSDTTPAGNRGSEYEKQQDHFTDNARTGQYGAEIFNIRFCSGFGQYHTNEPDPAKPDKTLTPYASITFSEIQALVDDPQSIDKPSAQWLIPSTYPSRNFKAQEKNGAYWLLWADMDKNPLTLSEIGDVIEPVLNDCDFELYNSRSATEENQKARLLIPLSKPLAFADWTLAQQTLNDKLAAHGIIPDRANERAAQLCYLPNRGAFYESDEKRNNEYFDPLQFWGAEIDEKRQKIEAEREALEQQKRLAIEQRESLRYSDKKDGLIDAFNRAYTCEEILVNYGYDQRGNSFRHPNSQSGSYSGSINPETGRYHALSPNDPLYVEGDKSGHDAFSVFQVLHHNRDQKAALRDAGDNIIKIDGESWNKVKQRIHEQEKAKNSSEPPPRGEPLKLAELFSDLTLTEELVEEMANAEFLIPNVIVKGHLGIYAAPANGGKSALFRYFCELLCKDGMKVFYINVDAGANDLKRHYEHAKKHGYDVIAPDAHRGKSTEDVIAILKKMADSGQSLDKTVFILDTLKKFVDVINKSKAKEFYKLLRALTVRGATVCCLGHCNKYKGEDGLPIYEGTADLRNDCDDLIYFDGALNESTNVLEITTRPDKERATFHPVSFHIDRNDGLRVKPLCIAINILPKDDREIIELAKSAINAGRTKQGDIIEYVKERSGSGDRKIKGLLDFYSKGPRPEFNVSNTGFGKTKCYGIQEEY